MKAQIDKNQESQKETAQRVQLESSPGGEVTITDNRPATTVQRKLRSGINSSEKSITPAQRKIYPEHSRSNNTGLPDNLKSGIENLSGYNMDDVKVHYNSSKPAQLQAHAYAQGTDIHLGPGQEKHLPHEAWHVVQQKQGRVKSTMQLKSKIHINDDTGLEKEADVMGSKALSNKSRPSVFQLQDKQSVFTQCKVIQRNTVKERIEKIKKEEIQHLLERVSEGIQDNKLLYSLEFVDDGDSKLKATVKANMALAGHNVDFKAEDVIKHLAGPNKIKKDALRGVIEHFKDLPNYDLSNFKEEEFETLAHFTKEGYENVTGVSRGGIRYDKAKKKDRKMKSSEWRHGVKTLNDLIKAWENMPKYNKNRPVFRSVHKNKGIDEKPVGIAFTKSNPTSTSVSLDLSREGSDKTSCRIIILGISEEGKVLPVDTRAVSTYAHEGEILLPPGTTFMKIKKYADYTDFAAILPYELEEMELPEEHREK